MAEEDYQGHDEYAPLVVELWFESVPEHANPLLHKVIEDAFAHVEASPAEVVITHEQLIYATEDGVPGWGATVLTSRSPLTMPPLDQTWQWGAAREVLSGCRGALVLTERLRAWVDPWRRVDAFREVLTVVVEAMSPEALVWPGADVVTEPSEVAESLLGFYNVRRTRSPESADGWIIDTWGLEGLNMPDLEVHCRGLDPDEVSEVLAEHAEAFIKGTEFIADGDPVVVEGFGPGHGEMWFTARYAVASTGPGDRRVVAFVPPPAHALGAPPEPDLDEGERG